MTANRRDALQTLSESDRSTVVSDREVEQEFKRQKNRQTHLFRKVLFWSVLVLMLAEVVGMFVIVILQGVGVIDLDRWALIAFEAGVLVQTFGLAKIITMHLFPHADDSHI